MLIDDLLFKVATIFVVPGPCIAGIAWLIARREFIGQPPLFRFRNPNRAACVFAMLILPVQHLFFHYLLVDNYYGGLTKLFFHTYDQVLRLHYRSMLYALACLLLGLAGVVIGARQYRAARATARVETDEEDNNGFS